VGWATEEFRVAQADENLPPGVRWNYKKDEKTNVRSRGTLLF